MLNLTPPTHIHTSTCISQHRLLLGVELSCTHYRAVSLNSCSNATSAITKAYKALNIYTSNIKKTVSDAAILLLKKDLNNYICVKKKKQQPSAIYFLDTLCAKTLKKKQNRKQNQKPQTDMGTHYYALLKCQAQ